MILGHGTDIAEVDRVEALLAKHGEKVLRDVFSEAEAAYCQGMKRSAEHFAGRFAAKEAVMKALGSGLSMGVHWRDVEIIRGENGRPEVVLTGIAKKRADDMGVQKFHVSISHCKLYATASVVAEGNGSTAENQR